MRDSKYACLYVAASRAFDFEKVKVIRFKRSSVLISFCYLQKQSVPNRVSTKPYQVLQGKNTRKMLHKDRPKYVSSQAYDGLIGRNYIWNIKL